jgi:hypothetical protein
MNSYPMAAFLTKVIVAIGLLTMVGGIIHAVTLDGRNIAGYRLVVLAAGILAGVVWCFFGAVAQAVLDIAEAAQYQARLAALADQQRLSNEKR